MKAKELDEKFERDEEDILDFFDLDMATRPNLKIKRVNLDLPSWLITELDKEAKRLGVSRQSLMKIWLAERIERIGRAA